VNLKAFDVVLLSQAEFDALPDYSCTLPDSYKRPISEGGRPWKRRINYDDASKGWMRGEYLAHPTDPTLLNIKWELIALRKCAVCGEGEISVIFKNRLLGWECPTVVYNALCGIFGVEPEKHL
jgi:hypothetical protein